MVFQRFAREINRAGQGLIMAVINKELPTIFRFLMQIFSLYMTGTVSTMIS